MTTALSAAKPVEPRRHSVLQRMRLNARHVGGGVAMRVVALLGPVLAMSVIPVAGCTPSIPGQVETAHRPMSSAASASGGPSRSAVVAKHAVIDECRPKSITVRERVGGGAGGTLYLVITVATRSVNPCRLRDGDLTLSWRRSSSSDLVNGPHQGPHR
jgi:hypothetical protein